MKKIEKKLNKKEIELYYGIKDFIEKNNYSPSYRELLNLKIYKSISSIYESIIKLNENGFIEINTDKNGRIKHRTIRVIYTSKIREKLEKMEEKIY